MTRPYELTDPVGSSWAGLGQFRRAGRQVHRGVELDVRAALAGTTTLHAVAAFVSARVEGAGVAEFDGVQVQNVPVARARVDLSHRPGGIPGLELAGRWVRVGARNARADGAAVAPGYDRFDVSAVLTDSGPRANVRTELAVVNLFDRRYWRDAGQAYSADLLFPGAPRAVFFAVSIVSR